MGNVQRYNAKRFMKVLLDCFITSTAIWRKYVVSSTDHSLTNSLTNLLAHSLTKSLTHSLTKCTV